VNRMARLFCAFTMALFLAYQARADQITTTRLDAPVTVFECKHFGQTVRMPEETTPYEVYRVAHCTGGILVLAPVRETRRPAEVPETEI